MKTVRILLADDHNLVRQGIANIIESFPEYTIVAEAEDGELMVDKFEKFKPDIVISDISMPKLTGISAARRILEIDKNAKIIFLTMYESDEYIYKAYRLGAYGLLHKNIIKGELISALRMVCAGNKYFAGRHKDEIKSILKRYDEISKKGKLTDSPAFTDKEIEILTEIARGLTSEEIAAKLTISKRTIDGHRSSIMTKLSLKSLPQLIKYAMEFVYAREKEK